MVTQHFELYATRDGIIAIMDPTRVRIVHFLASEEREFDEIVSYIGKAKSTISSHLDILEKSRVIISSRARKDQRKKLYKSSADLIGMSSKEEPVFYVMEKQYFKGLEEE